MTDLGVPALPTASAAGASSDQCHSPIWLRLRGHRTLAAATAAVIAVVSAWWAVTHWQLMSPVFLPGPGAVIDSAIRVAVDGFVGATLAEHTFASLGRMTVALLAAVVAGIPIGLAVGLNPEARGAFGVLIEFYRPIPPLAYLPLIVVWFGIGELSKVLLIFLAIFAPVVISTSAGIRSVNPSRVNAARSLGAGPLQVVLLVVLPSALPSILTGIRIGLGLGWATLVAAELVAATEGLGFMVQSASQYLVTDIVLLGIFVIALIAFAMELLVRIAQRLLVPWVGHE